MGELGYEIPTESEITDDDVRRILELYSGIKGIEYKYMFTGDLFHAQKVLGERGFQLIAEPNDTQSITFGIANDSIDLEYRGLEGYYRLVLEIDAEKKARVLNCGGSTYDYSERYEGKQVIDFFSGLISKIEEE